MYGEVNVSVSVCVEIKGDYNTMCIIMCVFTYTCSQKHNNLSDSITI